MIYTVVEYIGLMFMAFLYVCVTFPLCTSMHCRSQPVWSLAVIFSLTQISIPLFKKWIYEHLSSQTEAKFNLMHTMYLVYSFDPSDEECRDTSNVIFGTLYNRYFEPEKHEVNH